MCEKEDKVSNSTLDDESDGKQPRSGMSKGKRSRKVIKKSRAVDKHTEYSGLTGTIGAGQFVEF